MDIICQNLQIIPLFRHCSDNEITYLSNNGRIEIIRKGRKLDLKKRNSFSIILNGSLQVETPGKKNDIYFADLDPETGKASGLPYKAVQTFEGLNSLPAFSPDGKRLVYTSLRGTGERDSGSLVIRSLETGEERELQLDLPLRLLGIPAPCWSPEESQRIWVWQWRR